MKNKLPFKIDPIKSAQRRLYLNGIYLKENLVRVSDVVKIVEDADCFFSFSFDEEKFCVLELKIRLGVELICQRCNNSFFKRINLKNKFVAINENFARKVPEFYEISFIDEFGEVDLLAIIEDELILSLPAYPMHDDNLDNNVKEYTFGEVNLETDNENAFSVLSNYKFKS